MLSNGGCDGALLSRWVATMSHTNVVRPQESYSSPELKSSVLHVLLGNTLSWNHILVVLWGLACKMRRRPRKLMNQAVVATSSSV